MKNLLTVGLAMVCLPILALAQSDFDGTWKINLSKAVIPDKAHVFLLQNGMYQCKTCVPTISVKADGDDHDATGSPYYDAISIKVLDDRSIEKTEKKNGKTVATSRFMVSPDGSTATFEFTDSSNTNADPVIGKGVMSRIAKAKHPPAGSHAISGSWRISKMESFSDNALAFTFKVDGERVSMTNPTGQSYTATLDGTDAPYKGDPGINAVSTLRLGKDTFMETDKRNGKTIRTRRIMINPGADNTMTIIVDDASTGTTVFAADKQ
jgi:hypothetical protein